MTIIFLFHFTENYGIIWEHIEKSGGSHEKNKDFRGNVGFPGSIVLALRQTSAAIAIGMQYGSIVWLFLAGLIVTWRSSGSSCERRDEMRKALGWDNVLPVLLITAGVIFFMLTGLEGSSTTGNLIALTESVSFALLTVSAKKAAGENPLGLTDYATESDCNCSVGNDFGPYMGGIVSAGISKLAGVYRICDHYCRNCVGCEADATGWRIARC